jgi:hypothetical protein
MNKLRKALAEYESAVAASSMAAFHDAMTKSKGDEAGDKLAEAKRLKLVNDRLDEVYRVVKEMIEEAREEERHQARREARDFRK